MWHNQESLFLFVCHLLISRYCTIQSLLAPKTQHSSNQNSIAEQVNSVAQKWAKRKEKRKKKKERKKPLQASESWKHTVLRVSTGYYHKAVGHNTPAMVKPAMVKPARTRDFLQNLHKHKNVKPISTTAISIQRFLRFLLTYQTKQNVHILVVHLKNFGLQI